MLLAGMTANAQQQSISMLASGDNPGLGFNYQGCERNDGVVTVKFQFFNIAQSAIEKVTLASTGDMATTVAGPDGTAYTLAPVDFGGKNGETVTIDVPQGERVDAVITVTDVPADVKSLGKVVINSCGQFPGEENVHSFSVILENVSMLDRTKTAAPAAAPAASSPAAKEDEGNGHTPQPGKAAGIFVTGNAVKVPAGGWEITQGAVGPIKVGENTRSMPGIVDGLFNKVKRWNDTDETLYLNGKEVITVNIANDRIAGVKVMDKVAKVKIGDTMVGVGDKLATVGSLPGVQTSGNKATYNGVTLHAENGTITAITIGK